VVSESNPMAELVGPFCDASGVAVRLGCAVEDLAGRVASGDLLGTVTSDGVPLYPAFQFTVHGAIRPELIPALRVLAGCDGWTVAVWLRTRNDDLDDLSPDEYLAAGGDPDWVRVLASRWAALLSA
jgi:hypothetical protein